MKNLVTGKWYPRPGHVWLVRGYDDNLWGNYVFYYEPNNGAAYKLSYSKFKKYDRFIPGETRTSIVPGVLRSTWRGSLWKMRSDAS